MPDGSWPQTVIPPEEIGSNRMRVAAFDAQKRTEHLRRMEPLGEYELAGRLDRVSDVIDAATVRRSD